MNINNWEVLDFEDSKLYLKEEHEILIVDNKFNYERNIKNNEITDMSLVSNRQNLESNIVMKDENSFINKIIKTFDNKFYENLYNKYITYSFILLKPFELFYFELNKNELDQYIF